MSDDLLLQGVVWCSHSISVLLKWSYSVNDPVINMVTYTSITTHKLAWFLFKQYSSLSAKASTDPLSLGSGNRKESFKWFDWFPSSDKPGSIV